MYPRPWRPTLSFLLFAAASNVHAEEPRSPLFNPRIEPSVEAVPPRSESPLSRVTRTRISEAVLARFNGFEAPGTLAPHLVADEGVVRMAPYIVPSDDIRPTLLVPPETATLRFLRTGTLFYQSGRRFDAHLRFHVWLLQATGPHRNEEFSRYELRFRLSF
jgi:hypothetical protein